MVKAAILHGKTAAGVTVPLLVTSAGKVVISTGSNPFPEATNFAALPDATLHNGEVYLVLNPTGVIWVNRKKAGMYISDGASPTDWRYLGQQIENFNDATYNLFNDSDPTKIINEDLSGITTGTTRTYTRPDKGGTYALLDDAFTEATITTTDNVLTTIATIPIALNTAIKVSASYSAMRTDVTGDRAGYDRIAMMFRDGGAAARQGSTTTPFTRESTAAYNAQINPSSNDAVIQVQGQTGHTINWKVKYMLTEVS